MATSRRLPRAAPGQGQITVLQLDQPRVRLVLHPGFAEPAAGVRWRVGPRITRASRARTIGAFNGGFKMADARGGWKSQGRTVVPLVRGAGSVIIYADGWTDIRAWRRGLASRHEGAVSVRQNLKLLVRRGRPWRIHPHSQLQLDAWWGHAFDEARLISRSALGITRNGTLVWAAGTDITIAALAHALIRSGVVRAVELDINAPLVRGFFYRSDARLHTRRRITGPSLPLVSGQTQIHPDPGAHDPAIAPHCTYLAPCSRDFFSVIARRAAAG